MSEQNPDIFAYQPITEWNNEIVEFGMPSTDGNTRLTEICLAAESCLEASNNATQLSFTDYSFQLARSSPVQKIIRTLFGEDTGIEIETFAAISESGVAYFMSPMVTAAALLLEKDWIYDITIDKMNIGFQPTFFTEYTGSPIGEKSHTMSTRHWRHVLNPFADGNVIYGNRAIAGNWDTDGEPYYEFTWEGISTGKCSDNSSTSEGACINVVLGGYCRVGSATAGYCSNPTYSYDEAVCLYYGTCSNPAYNNQEANCINDASVWVPSYTWSSSIGTPPMTRSQNDGI